MKKIATLLTFLTACGDPLVDPQEIINTRALGLRVSVESAPEVSTIAPGERFSVSLLVAAPEPRELSAALSLCRVSPSTLGAPECQGGVFATVMAAGNTDADLTASFRLSDTLMADDEWMIRGAICDDARVVGDDAIKAECDDGEPPLELFYRTRVPAAGKNKNPELGDDELALNNQSLPAFDPMADCTDDALPRLSASRPSRLTFRMRGDDRETLPRGSKNAREGILFSHALDAPGLSRAFSSIESEDDSRSFELSFDPNETELKGREQITFYLIARDGRGGSDWLRQRFCLDD